MATKQSISTLFLDIGGVLLTNGWDHKARERAAKTFSFETQEFEARHKEVFNAFEVGKISLDEYLETALFYKKRTFTKEKFCKFMFDQSKPFPEMLELIGRLKSLYGLKVVVVSNEGRELTEYRIKKFQLGKFIDFFVSSCFVHLRKPDPAIYKLALDAAQTPIKKILYIEDRPLYIETAKKLGIQGILHTDLPSTQKRLLAHGLS